MCEYATIGHSVIDICMTRGGSKKFKRVKFKVN